MWHLALKAQLLAPTGNNNRIHSKKISASCSYCLTNNKNSAVGKKHNPKQVLHVGGGSAERSEVEEYLKSGKIANLDLVISVLKAQSVRVSATY